ncbi:MAG TPA: chemotaxis response regulator protein-glutamate methylesterase [Vicinamibacteria bacterium]|nr:chemotaxis response regulator protein-glutamate methylesterase [Vicinamibacteria bacterium]
MIRVVVVDDSPFVRRALGRMLGSAGDIEVVGLAADGQDGLEKVRALRPDVVTLDVKMPRMGGLEALRRIMQECPTAVLLMSSLTSDGGEVTLRGLELGAMDFVDKSSVQGNMNLLGLADELLAKVRALASVPRSRLGHALQPGPEAAAGSGRARAQRAEVVAIGTSTGGPPALQAIIPRLPAHLDAPLLIVQHMPPGFTRSLAERLDQRSRLRVREAEDGEVLRPGTALVAPAGRHMRVRRRDGQARICLDDEPRAALHRPSIDVLMSSVAKVYGRRTLGVLLTGMGSDGVEGLRAIRAAGGRTLAESEDSAVIYGMPKAAVEAGVVDQSVTLARMADEIVAAV